MGTEKAAGHKGAGRPRRDGTRSANQRAEIIEAAMSLFEERSYRETTMSQIAQRAGLKQNSLYYWFASKQDILRSMLESNRASLRAARQSLGQVDDPAVVLAIALQADARYLCSLPFDYYILESVARDQRESFSDFFDDYGQLQALVAQTVQQGIDQGRFNACDAQLTAEMALAANESLQHRHRADRRGNASEAQPLGALSAAQVARQAALWALCALCPAAQAQAACDQAEAWLDRQGGQS